MEFAEVDPEDLTEADNQLSKLAAQFWPSSRVITKLATDMDELPSAVARHVLDEINAGVRWHRALPGIFRFLKDYE